MKITMVLGSPRLESISTKMAQEFARGAQENRKTWNLAKCSFAAVTVM